MRATFRSWRLFTPNLSQVGQGSRGKKHAGTFIMANCKTRFEINNLNGKKAVKNRGFPLGVRISDFNQQIGHKITNLGQNNLC